MIAGTIFNNLVETLNNDANLKEYIKFVFAGRRYAIEPDSIPCIMVEPTANNEIERDFGQITKVFFKVDVIAIVGAPADPDYTIVGDKAMGYIGVLDIENDIRACLSGSNTLGDSVEDIQIMETIINEAVINNAIIREVKIPIKVLYRQNNGV